MEHVEIAGHSLADFRRAAPALLLGEGASALSPVALSIAQLQTLAAVVNRIIPADDCRGGWDAGVGDYILRQLNGDLRHLADEFLHALDQLDQESVARFGLTMPSLSAPLQDQLLELLQNGDSSIAWTTPPPRFMAMLVHLSQEGFYAGPGNGGNRNEIAWKMIGYDHRPLGRPSPEDRP